MRKNPKDWLFIIQVIIFIFLTKLFGINSVIVTRFGRFLLISYNDNIEKIERLENIDMEDDWEEIEMENVR